LSVPREDVTIVLMYRTPRLQQWLDIWDIQSDYDDYESFICEDDEADKVREYVATAMNVGLVAKDFLQNGFNVVVVDEQGTQKAKNDLSHTVACRVLEGVECTSDDWVVNLEDQLTEVDQTEDSEYSDWSDLSLEQLHDLESLFLQRDCVYQAELESHDQFRSLNKETLFSKCEITSSPAARQQLMDPGFLVDFMRMQMGCGEDSFDPYVALPDASTVQPGKGGNTGKYFAGKLLLIIILLLLVVSGGSLAYLLFKNHRRGSSEAEMDGLFHKSGTRGCLFRKRRNSEGSTESSTDEESPPSSPSKGLTDVSLEDDKLASLSSGLCKACQLVRIDPKCPFCHGGLSSSEASSNSLSFRASIAPTHHYTDTQKNDIYGSNEIHKTVVSIDDFKFGSKQAELAPRKSKNSSSRSRAFRKLRELAKLKKETGEDGDSVLNPDNLQMDRDDESVISFS
jgi:hypothetical protein